MTGGLSSLVESYNNERYTVLKESKQSFYSMGNPLIINLKGKLQKPFDFFLKGTSGQNKSSAQMKEREKCKKKSHYRPQCAKWFSRYSISKSGIWTRWISPFGRFSASFSIKYDVTDAILQDNEKMKV